MNYSEQVLRNGNIEIDLSMVYDICDNDQGNIEKLVFTFLKSIPDIISSFDEYLITQNFNKLYKTAHSAKSSLSVFKIEDLFNLVILIENSGKPGDYETLKTLVGDAKLKYIEVESLLTNRFKTIDPDILNKDD